MPYSLPRLPFSYDALEPVIDARTMRLHHDRHHAAYVRKLNAALAGQGILEQMALEDILADLRVVPAELRSAVRNNGGGHLNHSLYWHTLSPEGGGEPGGKLAAAIRRDFGSFVDFQEEFTRTALDRFGSGWAWLSLEATGQLEVFTTPNQDSPIMYGSRPVLGLDLWEHAYYLTYQEERSAWVHAWWRVVHWGHVAQVYAHLLESARRRFETARDADARSIEAAGSVGSS